MSSYIPIPLDSQEILRKKNSLKRILNQQNGLLKKRIAILGGSTTSEIKDILELFLLDAGIKPEFYESDYNKYFEELAFENIKLEKFNPELILIHTTIENINNFPTVNDSDEIVINKIQSETLRFINLWENAFKKYGCPLIQNNFENPHLRPLGNLDFSDYRGKTNFIRTLNDNIADYARKHENFYVHDINHLSSWLGLEKWYNRRDWYLYKYAFSFKLIPEFSQSLSSIIKAIFGKSKKALVLDLDNTLWGGVIGDDGIDGIKIGNDTAIGEAHSELQSYLRELHERGILLTVASKNDYDNALEGLNHPQSLLKINYFSDFHANWEPKTENIKAIVANVNLGIESLVFLDDNPAERELVKQQLPDVTVPNIGADVANYASILNSNFLFEPASISSEDLERNGYYQGNVTRKGMEGKYLDYGDYLNSLEMTADILKFSTKNLQRITQLVNKTNQFNLTTRRYTYDEIEGISKNPNIICLSGNLKDKFGDNGLITVVIVNIREKIFEIDLWLMSCRVIKREMELAIFDEILAIANERGVSEIIGKYIPTKKNNMVANFYSDLGFKYIKTSDEGESNWSYSVSSNVKRKNIHIKVNNEY